MYVGCVYNSADGYWDVLSVSTGSSTSVGTVTSIDVSGGTTGLTTSGGPITTNGTITLAGTLATANGGTNLTSFTANGAVYATSTSALTTGTLPIASGGTNSTATPTAGGAGYGTGTAHAYSTAGTSGQALLSGGSGAPTFGTLTAANGGTGQTSYAVGDLLYASTTSALSKLADVATGNAVISGGVGVAPSYGKIGLTTHVSGTLPTANGGTNLTSFTANGIVYASSTSALATGSALQWTGTNLSVGGGAQTPSVAVTFSATAMTVNCALSNVFTTTFTANVTTAPTISNASDGQTINWFITQDATGSRTMTWPTSFKWAGGTAGVLSTAANSVDLLVATYRSSTGFWYASLSKAFS
jgi:hypothetical protein